MTHSINNKEIIVVKDLRHRYTAVSDTYAQLFGFKQAKDCVGLNDYILVSHACESGLYNTDTLAEEFIAGDEKAINNGGCYLMEAFSCMNNFGYYLIHKKPTYEGNKLSGIYIHALSLGPLSPEQLRVFMQNPNIQISPKMQNIIEKSYNDSLKNPYDLSSREKECLELLKKGKSAKDIARMLILSPRTIESYISNIKLKLRVNKTAEAIAKFYGW